jgi:hypothetical protein
MNKIRCLGPARFDSPLRLHTPHTRTPPPQAASHQAPAGRPSKPAQLQHSAAESLLQPWCTGPGAVLYRRIPVAALLQPCCSPVAHLMQHCCGRNGAPSGAPVGQAAGCSPVAGHWIGCSPVAARLQPAAGGHASWPWAGCSRLRSVAFKLRRSVAAKLQSCSHAVMLQPWPAQGRPAQPPPCHGVVL